MSAGRVTTNDFQPRLAHVLIGNCARKAIYFDFFQNWSNMFIFRHQIAGNMLNFTPLTTPIPTNLIKTLTYCIRTDMKSKTHKKKTNLNNKANKINTKRQTPNQQKQKTTKYNKHEKNKNNQRTKQNKRIVSFLSWRASGVHKDHHRFQIHFFQLLGLHAVSLPPGLRWVASRSREDVFARCGKKKKKKNVQDVCWLGKK